MLPVLYRLNVRDAISAHSNSDTKSKVCRSAIHTITRQHVIKRWLYHFYKKTYILVSYMNSVGHLIQEHLTSRLCTNSYNARWRTSTASKLHPKLPPPPLIATLHHFLGCFVAWPHVNDWLSVGGRGGHTKECAMVAAVVAEMLTSRSASLWTRRNYAKRAVQTSGHLQSASAGWIMRGAGVLVMAQLIFQKAQKFSVNGLTKWIRGLLEGLFCFWSHGHEKTAMIMRWHHFGTTAPQHPRPSSACCRPAGVDGALFSKGVNWNWVDMRDHQLVIIIFHLFYAEFFFNFTAVSFLATFTPFENHSWEMHR